MEMLEKLAELDEKHNEILSQLSDLDAKIAQTLKEWTKINDSTPESKVY